MNILTPTEAAQKQLDAYNARDIETFLSVYSPDVKVYDQPTGELRMSGHAAMRDVYTKMFAENPENHAKLLNRTAIGNFVIDHEYITGRVGREPYEAVAIYEVQHGQIIKIWFIPE